MKLQVSKDLRDEHEDVLTGLELLQAIGRSLERQGVSTEVIEDGEKLLEFFSVFGDGCHHAKEERYFFPEVERLKLPFDQDRIDKLVEEHEQGRGYIKSMRKVFDSLRTNEVKKTSDFGSLADEYTRMLSDHIDVEDELFLHFDAAVSPETDRHLAAKFDKFEDQVMGAGVHERFHRLLESLSAKYLQEGRTE